MPNSIVDNENAHTFASKFMSFDDASSTLSEREDFLLVLVSSLLESTTQGRNQKRALTLIEACGVQPEVLDAADPANALVRDELCEMSGIREVFPQFFLVQGDCTSFFADFAELQHMNEEGMLAEWLSMELPIAKLSSKNNQVNDGDECTNTPANDDCNHISQRCSTNDNRTLHSSGIESDHESVLSSSTEDLFSVASLSKILNSIVPDEQLQHQYPHIEERNRKIDDDNQNVILSMPTASTAQDEWSDPLLLERYEDEILALEDYLQEREEDEGENIQGQRGVQDRNLEQKEEMRLENLQEGSKCNDYNSDVLVYLDPNLQSSDSSNKDDSGEKEKNKEKKVQENKCSSVSSLSCTATTVTNTPTSSSSLSRSPDRHRLHENSVVNNSALPFPSPSPSLCHTNKNNGKDILCNVSMETVSTRSETEQLLRAKVEELRRKCEILTAERYIVEGQLKEARQRNNYDKQHSSDRQNIGTIHKFQLQQTLICACCTKVFKSNLSSLNAPIASQSCGHSICRNCCHKRLSATRRHRDENTMNSSERLRSTISSDLFMCGMGDISQVYSPSFEERQRQLQECESCPICYASRAFRRGKLYVNESLCVVLKLLDN